MGGLSLRIKGFQTYGALNSLAKRSERSGEQSENLPKFPIDLSEKLPE